MIEILDTAQSELGECPIWDGRIDRLWSVDIEGWAIRRFDPSTGSDESFPVHGRPGSMALTPDPDVVLVAIEDTVGHLRLPAIEWTPLVTVDTGGPANRLNDGALDRQGRLWVGTMHAALAESTGLLYRVDGDGSFAIHGRNVGIPNGIAFSGDGRTMYYADSILRMVWAYDYEPDDGTRSNERVVSDYRHLPGSPDGGTVDEDDCYWVASVFGSEIVRFTPDGRVDRVVEVPIETPTKPAFGGSDLSTMYVTSIKTDEVEGTVNGHMMAIDAGVRGVPEPIFPV